MNISFLVNYLLYEAVSVDAIYKGARDYLVLQPAKKDRILTGDLMRIWGNIESVKIVPYFGTKVLFLVTKVKGEDNNNYYTTQLQFYKVNLAEKPSSLMPIKWKDKSGKVFYSSFISPNTDLAVNCNCADFRFTFSYYLKQKGSLLGKVKSYTRKTTYWKPRNIAKVVGGCKHIFAILSLLEKLGVLSTQKKSYEIIDISKYL